MAANNSVLKGYPRRHCYLTIRPWPNSLKCTRLTRNRIACRWLFALYKVVDWWRIQLTPATHLVAILVTGRRSTGFDAFGERIKSTISPWCAQIFPKSVSTHALITGRIDSSRRSPQGHTLSSCPLRGRFRKCCKTPSDARSVYGFRSIH